MKVAAPFFVTFATVSQASYHGNLNYRSPSFTHAGLGIDVPKVEKRMVEKRDGGSYQSRDLKFTHGVSSV